eukprot:TRINITY_DN1464_c1_g2_i1.p1 TRINITY_DN1464_c1_g2~~TRINITY_DN1464_c1_g2_i1.p1  ORF type:complete len:1631 (-),score=237.44 TRINITY_DN1464_c1_g2_i1:393-5285(-)
MFSACEGDCQEGYYMDNEGICHVCNVKYSDSCAETARVCMKVGGEFFLPCTSCPEDTVLVNGFCEEIDPCSKKNCENLCLRTENDTVCICSKPNMKLEEDGKSCVCEFGYHMSGEDCIAICGLNNPCGPNALCSVFSQDKRVCRCFPGYAFGGTNFLENITIDAGESWNQEDNCIAIEQCVVGCGTYNDTPARCQVVLGGRICTCPPGYLTTEGSETSAILSDREPFDDCQAIPTCDKYEVDFSNFTSCVSGINSRTITCPPGYWASGPNSLPPNPTITLIGDEQWLGCQEINMCDVYSPALANGTCIPGLNKRTIICKEGYLIYGLPSKTFTGNEASEDCKAINPCETNNGDCEGNCIFIGPGIKNCSCATYSTLDANSLTCSCLPGYTKIGFGVCEDTNECSLGCGPDSICETPNPNQRVCKCRSGYHFTHSKTQLSVTVEGPNGWDSNKNCIPNEVCDTTFGATYGCGSITYDGVAVQCSPHLLGRTCTCPTKYFVTGGSSRSRVLNSDTIFPGCELDNRCNTFYDGGTGAYGCMFEQTLEIECSVDEAGRYCTCPVGYEAIGYGQRTAFVAYNNKFSGCRVVDECDRENPCGKHSDCTSHPGYRACKCHRGFHFAHLGEENITQEMLSSSIYLTSEEEWDDQSECTANDNCNYYFDRPPSGKFGCGETSDVTCVPTNDGRQCTCPVGSYMAGFGQIGLLPDTMVFGGCEVSNTCDHFLEPSSPGLYGCGLELFNQHPVTCETKPGGRTCTCPPGFVVVGTLSSSDFVANEIGFDGCIDYDECRMSNPCGPRSTCSSEANTRFCKCDVGFHISSEGPLNLSQEAIETRRLVVEGQVPWNTTNDCVANNHCSINFDFPSSGGYGCVDPSLDLEVGCDTEPLGRVCKCPIGYYIIGVNQTSSFFPSGERFPGCYDIDECVLYGYGSHATCVHAINARTITCDPGFYATPPNNEVIVLTGSQSFSGCLDFNECNYGCADEVVVACSDSTSNIAIPPNTRVCTCPNNYSPIGFVGASNVTLIGPDIFAGCVDCSPCPFNNYQLAPCNSTSDRACEPCESCKQGFWTSRECDSTSRTNCTKCSECDEGYYIGSKCNTRNDTVCAPCRAPCVTPEFEVVACINGADRVCSRERTPECSGGCGKGICIEQDVCECPIADGYYGRNCELNCHLTCLKYSATCSVSVHGRSWWCDCATGWFPSFDNQKCFPKDSETPHCVWGNWTAWRNCTECGSTRTREAQLIDDKSDSSCGSFYPERQICDTDCAMPLRERASQSDYGTYYAFTFVKFWKNNAAQYISAKYNITLVVDDNYRSVNGQSGGPYYFTISFFTADKYITTILSESAKRDDTEFCIDDETLEEAIKDVKNVTHTYIATLDIPEDTISWNQTGCDLILQVRNPDGLLIWPIFGGVVGGMVVILFVLCIVFIWYKTRPVDLSHLPPPVRWQYEQYYDSKSTGWVQDQSKKFYKKKLAKDSEEYEKMKEFFYGFLEASPKIGIAEAYAIFNPMLVTNFINYHTTVTIRMVEAPLIFAKQDWRLRDGAEEKEKVFDAFVARKEATGWNESLAVPIILSCHVTDFNVAMTICATGFSALSSVDAGWHGSGVYFTTYAMYACRYFTNRADPALLISFVTLYVLS